MAPTKPLLNLSTLTDQYTVGIDGKAYELRPMARFSVTEYMEFPKLSERIAALYAVKKPTAAQEEELSRVLDSICRLVLKAPAKVHESLTDVQRVDICNVFMNLPRPDSMTRERQTRRNGQSTTSKTTGASSSRASRGSTTAPTR